MLEKSKVLKIVNNEYEVKFPNSGQELDIILMIQQLSNGRYDSLKLSPFSKLQREALKIEAIAYFVILIPELKKNLTVKSLLDLDHVQMNVLIDIYADQLFPWLEEWEAILNNPKKDEKKA